MFKKIAPLFLIILFGLAGCSHISTTIPEDNNKAEQQESSKETENQEKTEKGEMTESEKMDKEEEEKTTEKKDMTESQEKINAGSYEDYAPVKLAKADSGQVVLFFHAAWCPICRALDASLNSTLDQIPSGLIILKTDYDKETALRQKYGVTYQHTLVQVDARGNLITKWSGSQNLQQIISKLK